MNVKISMSYRLRGVVCVVGALTMVLEILGLNIIAPHFGTSLVVSSNLLGVVLMGLAFGYAVGGVWADRMPNAMVLSRILLGAALWVGLFFPFRDLIMGAISFLPFGVAINSFCAIVLFFAPVNILFGIAVSYAVKLETTQFIQAGKQIGSLYAFSGIGSIFGVFSAGFLLVPVFSASAILFAVCSVLVVIAAFFERKKGLYLLCTPVFAVLFLIGGRIEFRTIEERGVAKDGSIIIDRSQLKKIADESSSYNRVQIYDGVDLVTSGAVRLMKVNRELHSGSFAENNKLLFRYSSFNTLAGHFNSSAKKALLIGGGGYSYAKFFLGDTPLFDGEKTWEVDGRRYSNDGKFSLPVLISSDEKKRRSSVKLLSAFSPKDESEREGAMNVLEAENQSPARTVKVRRVGIYKTGMPDDAGYVHVHETKKDGTIGEVVSKNIFVAKPRNIIGHSELLRGEHREVVVPLDRESREGEVLYPMLHRDNGNGRFDPILVDGYSKIRRLDVVEIDPKTTELARKYFQLNRADPRLRIFHEDGRTFINSSKEKYDIIYVDAFRSFYSVPFQLTTKEAAEGLFRILNDDGVVVVNVISALKGEYGKFFQAEYKTYSTVFPEVRVYAVTSPREENIVQNIVLIGFKSPNTIRETMNDDPAMNERLLYRWYGNLDTEAAVLTDEFAPVDYYINTFSGLSSF